MYSYKTFTVTHKRQHFKRVSPTDSSGPVSSKSEEINMLSLSQSAMKCTCSVLEVKSYMRHSNMTSQRHMQWRVGWWSALSSSVSELASMSHDTLMVATSDNVISCSTHNIGHTVTVTDSLRV